MSNLSPAEKVYVDRMAVHMSESGMSFDEAAKAVLEDDNRIYLSTINNSEAYEEIVANMAKRLYNSFKVDEKLLGKNRNNA